MEFMEFIRYYAIVCYVVTGLYLLMGLGLKGKGRIRMVIQALIFFILSCYLSFIPCQGLAQIIAQDIAAFAIVLAAILFSAAWHFDQLTAPEKLDWNQ